MTSRSIIRFLETYLDTYERISNTRQSGIIRQESGNHFIGDMIVSAVYSYFHPSELDEKEEKEDHEDVLPFVTVTKISSSEKECPICFDEYGEEHLKNKQIVITECGHLFHKECISNWLHEKKNCPVCRYEFMMS